MQHTDLDKDVFAVEKLQKKRLRKGKVEYLVKWVGWSEEHSSWEPRNNILDDMLLKEYEANEKSKVKSTNGHKQSAQQNPNSSPAKIKRNDKDAEKLKEDEKLFSDESTQDFRITEVTVDHKIVLSTQSAGRNGFFRDA